MGRNGAPAKWSTIHVHCLWSHHAVSVCRIRRHHGRGAPVSFDALRAAALARLEAKRAFAKSAAREEFRTNGRYSDGSMPHDARLLLASGRANAKAHKVSGPVVPYGMTYTVSTGERAIAEPSKNLCPHRTAKGVCVMGAACRKNQ